MFTIENINGVDLYLHQTSKFKQLSIAVLFQTEIESRKATLRSMLAYLLVDTNDDFATKEKYRMHLEKLYGTHISQVSYMHGKKHIMGVMLSSISGKLISDSKLLDEQMKVLKQCIYSHKEFNEDQLRLAKKYIKSKFNDIYENKAAYAAEMLSQQMIKDTLYHVNALGALRHIEDITVDELNDYYKTMILEDKLSIFVVGDVNDKKLSQFVKASFKSNAHDDFDVVDTSNEPIVFNEKEEQQDISQAKLSIGFRIDANILSDSHFAAKMFNGIFGGLSHSLLFKVVREKHSLCYSIHSSYDPYHGVVNVNLGIANDQKDLAYRLIMEQLEAIQKGEFDDELLEMTFLHMESALNKSGDSIHSLIVQAYHYATINRPYEITTQIAKYRSVDKKAVMQVAKTMQVEAVFFLKGVESDGN